MQRREANAKDDRPDTVSEAAESMLPAVALMRDVYGGTERLLRRPEKYLPRSAAERADDYKGRTAWSVFFPATRRTVEGLAGLAFRKDPVLGSDVPPGLLEMLENVDLLGNHLDVFLRAVLEDAIVAGHSFILIDAPRVPDDRRLSLGEERRDGIRPYMTRVQKESVISWRTEKIGARLVLTQVVIRELVDEDVGAFGSQVIERFRVYQREVDDSGVVVIHWEVHEIENGVDFTIDRGIIGNVTEIPLVPVHADRDGFFMSSPPLLDLAYTNLAHFRVMSDLLWALHISSVPIPVVKGVPVDGDLELGTNRAIFLPSADSSFEWVEHGGKSLGAARQMLIDQQTQMAVAGIGMLQRDTRAAETAESKKLDRSEQDSALAVTVRNLEDAAENALQFMADMVGLPTGGSVTFDRDFEKIRISVADMKMLADLHLAGLVSEDTVWSEGKAGGFFGDDFDADVERDRLGEAMFPREPATTEN